MLISSNRDSQSARCNATPGELLGRTAWLFVYSMIFVMAVTGQTISHVTQIVVK